MKLEDRINKVSKELDALIESDADKDKILVLSEVLDELISEYMESIKS